MGGIRGVRLVAALGGNGGQNVHSKGSGGGEEPLIAQLQLNSQLAIMSSQ